MGQEHAAQIDPELGHRDDAGVVHAHDGRPVTSRAGFTHEAEREAESTEADGRLDDHRRTTTQSPVGYERTPGVPEGDGTALRE